MLRLVLILLVIVGVAAFFTRPQEAAMREEANAVLNDPEHTNMLEGVGGLVAGERAYSNYYLAAKYTVALADRTLVECWGAFTQVQCNRPARSG